MSCKKAICTGALLAMGVGLSTSQPAWSRGDGWAGWDRNRQRDACRALARADFHNPVEIATAKLYVEYNATDEDLGVHGAFDDDGYSLLCVYDPSGRPILQLNPRRQLKNLTMAGIFFESREPPESELSFDDLKTAFPEGQYSVRGITYEGDGLIGAATFSHSFPAAPTITYPPEDEEVPSEDLVISWEPVTETVDGDDATITGYEIIITKEVDDDPNGFSRPTYDVHVPPNRTGLAVPTEFLEPGFEYELEILALEESGNQTISVSFFMTKE